MTVHLIVIANAVQARLYTRAREHEPLVALPSLTHPEGHLKASALGDDRAGHGGADVGRHGTTFGKRLDPHRKEHLHFAGEVARRIDALIAQGACGALTLLAASPFLGELMAALGTHALERLTRAVDIDLTHFGLPEIEQRLAAMHATAHP